MVSGNYQLLSRRIVKHSGARYVCQCLYTTFIACWTNYYVCQRASLWIG